MPLDQQHLFVLFLFFVFLVLEYRQVQTHLGDAIEAERERWLAQFREMSDKHSEELVSQRVEICKEVTLSVSCETWRDLRRHNMAIARYICLWMVFVSINST